MRPPHLPRTTRAWRPRTSSDAHAKGTPRVAQPGAASPSISQRYPSDALCVGGTELALLGRMKKALLSVCVLATLSLVTFACGTSESASSGSPSFTPHFPKVHRESAAACGVAGPGNADPKYLSDAGADAESDGGGVVRPPSYECFRDADCTNGKDGRCIVASGGLAGSRQVCVYTECTSDGECGAGKVCQCNGTGSSCVQAYCRTDAECTDKLGCSPAADGYRCHTKSDECVDDTDCGVAATRTYCDFDGQKGHWVCKRSGYDG